MDYTSFSNSHDFRNYLLTQGYSDGSYKMRIVIKEYHRQKKEKNNQKALERAYNARTVFVPIDELDALANINN